MKVKVKNRSKSSVGYMIPDENITRKFAANETKNLEVSELEKLTYQPGGQYLLTNFLLINDKDVAAELNSQHIEPEYWMEEADVIELLKYGSLDKFLDCLDFAPQGVIDLIKNLSVTLPLTDTAKLTAIKEATGFDAAKAIQINKESMEVDQSDKENARGRRVAIEPVDEAANAPVRRVVEESSVPVVNKYEVVSRS